MRVLALCPGYTHTELHERAGIDMRRTPDWLWLDAEEVVDEAFAALARGTVVCVPSPQYKTIVAVARHLPARAWSGIGRQVRRRRRSATDRATRRHLRRASRLTASSSTSSRLQNAKRTSGRPASTSS